MCTDKVDQKRYQAFSLGLWTPLFHSTSRFKCSHVINNRLPVYQKYRNR